MDTNEVEWVVNDLAELGVRVNGECFFLYKGRSYQGGSKWRYVGKREFGECCTPPDLKYMPESYVGMRCEEVELWHDMWAPMEDFKRSG